MLNIPHHSISALLSNWKLKRGSIETATFILIIYQIWHQRNLSKYDHQVFQSSNITKAIEATLYNHVIAKNFKTSPGLTHWLAYHNNIHTSANNSLHKPILLPIIWQMPGMLLFKCNMDGAFSSSKAGSGGCIRNYRGQVLWAFSARIWANSPLMAELVSVLFSLTLCRYIGIKEIQFEVDSLWVINILSKGASPPAECFQVSSLILNLLQQVKVKFLHTYREGNKVAHSLAAIGKTHLGLHLYNAAQLPKKTRGLVALDALQVPAIRISN